MVAVLLSFFCSYTTAVVTTTQRVVLVTLIIVGCLLNISSTISPCDLEKTTKRFMTCNQAEYLQDSISVDGQKWDTNSLPYSISTQPLHLETIPLSVRQHALGSEISLTCISNCYGINGCPNTSWSFINGTGIAPLDNKYIINDTTLTIADFSSSDQEEYVCRVGNDKYSVVSYPVELKLFNFTSWSRDVYDVPSEIQDGQTIDLTISSSDAAILECSVQGAAYPSSLVVWSPLPDNVNQIQLPNGDLLVKQFTKTSNTFFCSNLVEGPVLKPHHLIYNVNVEPDLQGKPVMVAKPRSLSVISGSNVILYCLIHSNTTVTYHWYRDGIPVNKSNVLLPYVMIINDIADSGSYECMGSNQYGNVSGIAEITVLAHPSPVISVLSSTVSYRLLNNNTDIAISENIGAHDIIFVLNCSVEAENARYQWLYKGKFVDSTQGGSNHQVTINGSDVNEIIGSIQCLVSILDATGIGYMRIIRDKSNPPLDLMISYAANAPTFNVSWASPTLTDGYLYTLALQISGYIYETQTTETCVKVNMKVEAYAAGEEYFTDFNIRVNAQSSTDVAAGPSDYVFIPCERKETDCRGVTTIYPNPAKLTNMQSDLVNIDQRGHAFDYTLQFDNASTSFHNIPGFQGVFNECDDIYFDDQHYCFSSCCSFNDEEKCKLPEIPTYLQNIGNKISMKSSCGSTCYWLVWVCQSPVPTTDVLSFVTGDLQPNASGNITSIEWIGNKGTQLSIQIKYPPKDSSCFPTSLMVTCGNNHQQYTQTNSHNATIKFELSPDSCWDLCIMYFTYNNSIGISPRSTGMRLPPPNEGNVGGYHDIVYHALTQDYQVVNISWTLAEGMECLLEKGHISSVVFSFGIEGHSDCSSNDRWSGPFSLMNLTSTNMILNESTPLFNGKEVCVRVGFTLSNGDQSPVYLYSIMIKPDTTTNNNPDTSHSSDATASTNQPDLSNINQISTQLFLKTSLPVMSVLIFVGVLMLVIFIFAYKKCKKRNYSVLDEDQQQLLSPPDGSDVVNNKDDDTGTVVTKYEDLEINKNERMQSYLKDVETMAACKSDNDDDLSQEIWNKELSHPLHKEEIVVEAEVNHHEYDRKERKKKKKSKKKVEVEPMTIPSVSLLKGGDCETVQNASESVFKLAEDFWTDYQPHPSFVGGAGLNQMSRQSSFNSIQNERHELQEMNKSDYDDSTTPTREDTLIPLHDVNAYQPKQNSMSSVAGVATPYTTMTLSHTTFPSTPLYNTPNTKSITQPHTNLTQSHTNMTQPHTSLTHPHTSVTQFHTNLTQPHTNLTQPHTSMTQPHTNKARPCANMTPSCGDSIFHRDNVTSHASITDPLPPLIHPQSSNRHSHLVGPSTLPSSMHDTLSLITNNKLQHPLHSIPQTTMPDYSFQLFRSPHPPPLDLPRSPSRISSGLGSPTKSTGSCDSVFDHSDNCSARGGGNVFRHHSDATSGIESPGPLSPQVHTNFNFNRRLSSADTTGYLSDMSYVTSSRNQTSPPYIEAPVQRRTSADVYQRTSADVYPLQPRPSHLDIPPLSDSNSTSIRPHPLISSSSSSDYILSTPNATRPVHSSPTSYVLPSLLYTCNSETTTPTSVVAMETVDSRNGTLDCSNESFSESYSIDSNSSSLEDFIQKQVKEKSNNAYVLNG